MIKNYLTLVPEALRMAGKAIFLSLSRQVIYLIPLTLLLPLAFSASPILGVWWSIPLSDTISALTAAIMLGIELRRFQRLIAAQDRYLHSTPPLPD